MSPSEWSGLSSDIQVYEVISINVQTRAKRREECYAKDTLKFSCETLWTLITFNVKDKLAALNIWDLGSFKLLS